MRVEGNKVIAQFSKIFHQTYPVGYLFWNLKLWVFMLLFAKSVFILSRNFSVVNKILKLPLNTPLVKIKVVKRYFICFEPVNIYLFIWWHYCQLIQISVINCVVECCYVLTAIINYYTPQGSVFRRKNVGSFFPNCFCQQNVNSEIVCGTNKTSHFKYLSYQLK